MPRVAPPTVREAPKSPLDYFGSGTFDADHFGEDELDLALDPDFGELQRMLEPSPQSFRGTDAEPAHLESDLDLLEGSNAAAVQSIRATAQEPTRPWPTGTTPLAESLDIAPTLVHHTAGAGEPPDNPLFAPLYTARVFVARRALLARVEALTRAAEAAERDRDNALAEYVRKNRTMLEKHESTAGLFGPVVSAERLLDEQRRALSGDSADYDRRIEEWDARLAALNDQVLQKDRICDALAAELREKRADLQRVGALSERLYTELGPIADAIERSPDSLTATQSKRARDLDHQIASLRPQAMATERHIQTTEAKLAAARRERAAVERDRRGIEREKAAYEESEGSRIGARSAEVVAVENRLRTSFADVMRRVLALRGGIPVDPSMLDRCRSLDGIVAEATRELETHRRALDDYDLAVYRRGFWVAGAFVATLVVLLVFLAGG